MENLIIGVSSFWWFSQWSFYVEDFLINPHLDIQGKATFDETTLTANASDAWGGVCATGQGSTAKRGNVGEVRAKVNKPRRMIN